MTLAAGVTATVGSASQSGAINLSSVTGTIGAGAVSSLTLYSSGAVDVSGAIGTKIGIVTLTNSAGATFHGAVGSSSDLVSTVTLTATTGTVKFVDSLYATSLSNPASSFDLQFYGSTTQVVNFVTLLTTGTVYFGDLSTSIVDCVCTGGTADTLTFDRGISHAGTNVIAGNFTKTNLISCTGDCGINFSSGTSRFVGLPITLDFGALPMTFDNIVLGNGVTLTLGNGSAGTITIGSIAGIAVAAPLGDNLNCPSNIVINSTGTVSITRSIGTNIANLTLTQSGGTTFGGAVDTTTSVALDDTNGSIAFNGALTTPTLTTANQTYNLGLNATGTAITNAVNFLNTGTLALGASAGTQTYTGGFTATAPSASTLKGTINSSNAAMVLGPVTLGAATTLNTNATSTAGDITLGAVTLAGFN
jgi:hypothetical protein